LGGQVISEIITLIPGSSGMRFNGLSFCFGSRGVRLFVVVDVLGHLPDLKRKKPIGITGLPDFLGTTYQNGENIPSGHKIYQMATKYTKWPQNIPNATKYTKCHKIYQLSIGKIYQMQQNIPNATK
jgi:hypothetical protein